MRIARINALAVALFFVDGCYLAHEREFDAAGDAGETATPDAMLETAVLADAQASCPGELIPACGAGDRVVVLDRAACGTGARECVTIDVLGRGQIDRTSLCSSPATPGMPVSLPPFGTRVRFLRCVRGSNVTSVRVTVVDAPPSPRTTDYAGWAWENPATCGCEGFSLDPRQGVAVPSGGPDVWFAETQQALDMLGEGVSYRIEACAIAPCP